MAKKLDDLTKYYIERNIQLIENNQWKEFFGEVPFLYRGDVTQVFLDCGIDFLKYIKHVPNDCFGFLKITSIVLPDNIKSVGESAFQNCRELEKIILSNNLTFIGTQAFYCCKKLKTIDLPQSLENISLCAFRESGLEKIVIPEQVETLKEEIFYQCTDLKYVFLPKGIRFIEVKAFSQCISLKEIHYGGTEEQWEDIVKEYYWDDDTPLETIHCKDGDIEL